MISLLRSEIRRLTSRRVARITALIVLGITLLTLGRVFMVSSKDAGPELAKATAQAAADRAQCEAFRQNAQQQQELQFPDGFDCEEITASNYFNDPRLNGRDALSNGTKAVAVGVAIFAFAVAASFVGADWGAGTMQALLFWEPRRGRVLLAKGLALVAVVVAFLLFLEVVVYAALWLTAITRGTTEGMTAGLHNANVLTVLRGAVVVSVSALFGYAVAGLARHSGAALAGGFVYFVIVENLVRGLRPGWQRYLVGENFSAIVNKQTPVIRANADSLFTDEGLRLVYNLTGVRGAATLGLYLAVLLGAFYLSFTRRDVT